VTKDRLMLIFCV